MAGIVVGLLILLLAWYAHRQAGRGWGYEEDDLPATLRMNDEMLRGAVPLMVLVGTITLVVGIGSVAADRRGERRDAGSARRRSCVG